MSGRNGLALSHGRSHEEPSVCNGPLCGSEVGFSAQVMKGAMGGIESKEASDLFAHFRRACRRLAGPRGGVRVFVYAGKDGLTINDLQDGALRHDRLDDYRQVPPDWLSPVGGKLRVHLKAEYDRSTRYANVVLNGQGAWEDEVCTIPFFRRVARKDTLRDQAISKLGEGRVIEAESVIRDTVARLLSASALKKAGFSWRRGVAPEVVFRWKTGMSRGGRGGLSFAVMGHAMKPEHNALFKEYARLNDFPGLGNYAGTRVGCYRVLAAHELAHWLQYDPRVRRPDWKFKEPHGEGFRMVYRILRQELSDWDEK